MKYFLIIVFVTLFSPKPIKIEKVVFFKKFPLRGTTANISHNFNSVEYPHARNRVPSNSCDYDSLSVANEFSELINSIKAKRHSQGKLANIQFSGIFTENSRNHKFVICGDHLIIDFTARKNYFLEDSTKIRSLRSILKKVKCD